MKKNLLLVMILALALASTAVSAADIPLSIDWVKVDGDIVTTDESIEYELGQDLNVKVKVLAGDVDVNDVEIEAYISGYRYSQYEGNLVSDSTGTFDLNAGSSDTQTLSLQIPIKYEIGDAKLRIRVSNRNDASVEETYQLDVVGVDRSGALEIKSFTVSPSEAIEAGRALSFKVKVHNYGDRELDDVYVRVSIPELGISDDETLDNIEVDEAETFEELLLRVPACAEPGTYTAKAVVEFDEYESTTETMEIRVLEGGSCEVLADRDSESKTIVTVPESGEVVLGTTGAVYPVMISNLGSSAKTYTLTVSGADAWGTVRLDPASVVVVQPESVKTIYMYVSANENAQVGSQVFKVAVESDGESKQIVLQANIKEGANTSSDGLQRGIFIGLIVLIIVLIILGLIIGLSKLRGGNDDNDDEAQTYY